ncbi:Transmembrane protein 131 [Nymphon striatum]|nr:Transmembrane protein 131 [Nymphon striatum]
MFLLSASEIQAGLGVKILHSWDRAMLSLSLQIYTLTILCDYMLESHSCYNYNNLSRQNPSFCCKQCSLFIQMVFFSSFSDNENENIQTYTNLIGFHPPFLDFKLQPVGIPYIKKVVVHNPSSTISLHMLSISGSTVHFHCSFFLEKVIEPGGNTTFDVVFLSREQGPVENTLFIHTSLGSFKYKVQGEGAPNPYRLRPFLGVRVPLNSSYNPLINMHNPHGDTLQVTEMYSSGGDLHLELINGESEAPVDLWAIQPYETKPVMRASFIARKESNHTSYIRIKTNSSGEPYLVIPVEVEVSSEPGIYSPVEILDFGVIRSDDKQIQLTLNLLNSGKKPIQITVSNFMPAIN